MFMPNHMHGTIQLTDFDTTSPSARASLWEIVRVFKAASTCYIRRAQGQSWFAWQDEYYGSVIRTEQGLAKARQYILDNPLRWAEDKFYKSY
jgi:putative transposase